MTVISINRSENPYRDSSEIQVTYFSHSLRQKIDCMIQDRFLSKEAKQSLACLDMIKYKIDRIGNYTCDVASICAVVAVIFTAIAPLSLVFSPLIPILGGIIVASIAGAILSKMFYWGAKLYLDHKIHQEANKLCQILNNPFDVSFVQDQSEFSGYWASALDRAVFSYSRQNGARYILQDRFKAGLDAKDFIFLRKFIAMVDGFRESPEVQQTILIDLKSAVKNDVKERLVKQGRLAAQEELTQDYRNLVDNFCDDLLLRSKPISQLVSQYKFSRLYFKDDLYVIAKKIRATALPGSTKDRALLAIQIVNQGGCSESQNPELVRLRASIQNSKEAIIQLARLHRSPYSDNMLDLTHTMRDIRHHEEMIVECRQRIAVVN